MRLSMKFSHLLAIFAWAVFTVGIADLAQAAGDPDPDPPLAPLPKPMGPADNPNTKRKAELGKLLYFDPRLGGDASISCADCHDPKQGWGFNDPICRGYPGGVHWRNCHTTVNTGYLNKLFWQGSATSLEAQARGAATGGISGNGEKDVMEERLRQIPHYIKEFRAIWGQRLPVLASAWEAISTFERVMLSQYGNNPLDNYLNGDKSALSAKAIKGKELFEGKGNCIECHNGPMLTDEKYYNLGLSRAPEWSENGMNANTFRFELYAKGVHQDQYQNWKNDAGVFFNTKDPLDIGKFRTQPLRYLLYTAPYMHAGQFFDLEELVDFYNDGGGENEFTDGTHAATKTPILKKLNLSDDEKAAIVAFLDEISGDEIKMAVPALPEYAPAADAASLTQAKAKRAGLEMYLSMQGQ